MKLEGQCLGTMIPKPRVCFLAVDQEDPGHTTSIEV